MNRDAMTWQSAIVDVAVLAATCILAYLKILPSEAAVAIISAVIAARAALMKPPSDGGGGAGAAMAGSGAAALFLGIGSLLGSQRHL